MGFLTSRTSIALGLSLSGLSVACSSSSDSGPGTGTGASSSVELKSCDLRSESSAAPNTDACGDLTSPLGTKIQLGKYGAKMDVNVGAGSGAENTDPNDNGTCPGFAGIFKEDPAQTAQLLDVGTQPCDASTPNEGACLNFKLYTVYAPANWPDGPVPILSWGNGTCAQPEGYGSLLRYIASQGYFIVAANSREVGSGTEIRHGIDFALYANEDKTSPYYHHLDTTKVGVMGHSQGSAGAALAASDPRASAVILFNGGLASNKPFLAVSGDMDITGYTSDQMSTSVQGATSGAFMFFHNPAGMGPLKGHLVLMLSPERVTEAAAGFWDLQFKKDQAAEKLFVGEGCGLCGQSADFEYGEKGL